MLHRVNALLPQNTILYIREYMFLYIADCLTLMQKCDGSMMAYKLGGAASHSVD